MKWHFRTAGIVAALMVSALAATARSEITVFFAPDVAPFAAIARETEDAKQTIDMAIYSFSDARLRDAVLSAAKRKVTIRVLLNKARNYSAFANQLERAGVDVRYVNTILHHKFAIFDGPRTAKEQGKQSTVLTGSCNWTRSSFAKYDEDLISAKGEPELAAAYQREFNLLWSHAREFGKAIHPESDRLPLESQADVVFTSANMKARTYRGEPTFSSVTPLEKGVCGRRLIRAIDEAESSIDVAATHYRRKDINAALLRAYRRGVKVRVLLDGQEYHSEATTIPDARYDEQLAEQGVAVRYKVYSERWDYRTAKQMHCKYVVVDARLVLTGSLNLSASSELKTMENLLAVRDPAVVQLYVQRFAFKWNYGKGEFKGLVRRVGKAKRKPKTFAPISLTAKQIDELRGAYVKGR